jgi:hypothetical protein
MRRIVMSKILHKGYADIYKVNNSEIKLLIIFYGYLIAIGIENIGKDNTKLIMKRIEKPNIISDKVHLKSYYNINIIDQEDIQPTYLITGEENLIFKVGQYEYLENLFSAYIMEI